MTRSWSQEVIEEAFKTLQGKYGPMIITDLVMLFGGLRLTFPDLQDLYRAERNRRIRNEFTGFNYEELAIKYRLKRLQVRRIITKQA